MGSGNPREKQPYIPTPEQVQLANERKARRLAAKLRQDVPPPTAPNYSQHILLRSWHSVKSPSPSARVKLSIMTWNMLAQCLVRRELFPGSDCLKTKDREEMLSAEILHYDADILCLQEVDRLDSLLPRLRETYNNIYASGRGKLHGCMLLFRRSRFEVVSSKVVYYDEEAVEERVAEETRLFGATRRTKNIGLMAALRIRDDAQSNVTGSLGCLVATTHLFWHPQFAYERSRQSYILLREVDKFRSSLNLEDWPTFIAGDFNSQPSEATYSLLVGQELLDEQRVELEASRVVHASVDAALASTALNGVIKVSGDDEDEAGKVAEDDQEHANDVIPNSRIPAQDDGITPVSVLETKFRSAARVPVRSAYDEAALPSAIFGERFALPLNRKGRFEAMWTSFTPLWRLTLDYLFILGSDVHVLAVLAPHKTDNLEPGLPRKGICASDHIALAAEVEW